MIVEVYKGDYYGIPQFCLIRKGTQRQYSCIWSGWQWCNKRRSNIPLSYLDIGLDSNEPALQTAAKQKADAIKELTQSSPLELLLWTSKTPDQIFKYGTI
jgi:hypothetical protein